jgi:perosamine synthetase
MLLEKPLNEHPLMDVSEGIVLFYPSIPKNASAYINEVLQTRWIGQGPKVEEFETAFEQKFTNPCRSLAVGSGTDALHLAYLLSDIQEGDEVIVPVFTCTATNLPLLYIGAKPVFCDIDTNLNIDANAIEDLVTEKTKAIVCVHYGGLPCDMDKIWEIAKKYNLKVIEDNAHALGAKYNDKIIGSESDFSMFSFQAIKHITTGDGGMLVIKDQSLYEKAKRLRWFGIDRASKQQGIWENDITEIGYKYQMTDLSASMGLASLEEFDENLKYRQLLYRLYCDNLKDVSGIRVIGAEYTNREHAAWLLTAEVDNRVGFMEHLRKHKIESSQVHYRNDRYTIFGGRQEGVFKNMDKMEDRYIVLPLHLKVKESDVQYITDVIKLGW